MFSFYWNIYIWLPRQIGQIPKVFLPGQLHFYQYITLKYICKIFQVNLSEFSLFQLQTMLSDFWSSSVQCAKQKIL